MTIVLFIIIVFSLSPLQKCEGFFCLLEIFDYIYSILNDVEIIKRNLLESYLSEAYPRG